MNVRVRHVESRFVAAKNTVIFSILCAVADDFMNDVRNPTGGPPICYRGCRRRTHASAFSRTSWTALTLEVGKSPTEVPPRRRLPVAPPSAICEFASSSSHSWSSNRAVLDDGRQHGEQDQGARARPALAPAFARARDVYTGIEAGGSNWRKSLLRLIRYSYLPRRRPSAPRAAGRRLRCPRHYGWCYSADTAP